MSDLLEAAPVSAPPRTAEIQGLVDGALKARLYGWAWNAARPDERVTVELRLGEQTVARALADRDRPDLAKAGVGDGRHAFELVLTPECIERRAELSVMVRAADGTEAPIAVRVRRGPTDVPENVARVLEATAQAQRQLREEVQRLAQRLPQKTDEPAAPDPQLLDRLDTLTLWLTRIDEKLASLPQEAPPAPQRRRDGWQVVLLGALGGIAAAALTLAAWGFGR